MKIVEPKVFHIAQTTTDLDGVGKFLAHHGAEGWSTDAETGVEKLIEMAGRRCYQAWQTEDKPVSDWNANLSKVRVGNQLYIENILKSHHGSVLEHGCDTWAIENVTRVFTHEVVRHRLCAFSQESLRFVRPTSLNAYFPDVFKELPDTELSESAYESMAEFMVEDRSQVESWTTKSALDYIFYSAFSTLEDVQKVLVALLGMDTVKRAFGDKKKLQSAMRRLMPIGMVTGIIMTTNHRNWRHLIEMRTSEHSEEEIRKVFGMIGLAMREMYPAIYQDMRAEEIGGMPEITFHLGRV